MIEHLSRILDLKTIYLTPYTLSRDLGTFYIATLYLLWVICMGTLEKADTHALLSLIITHHTHFYDKYLRLFLIVSENSENFQLHTIDLNLYSLHTKSCIF